MTGPALVWPLGLDVVMFWCLLAGGVIAVVAAWWSLSGRWRGVGFVVSDDPGELLKSERRPT
jgi:hypothetical protein